MEGQSQPSPSAGALPLLPKLPPLDNTYGAILLGSFASLMLYGLTLHQAYRYIRAHATDGLYMKCYVVFIVVLDSLHSGLCMHISYWYLVKCYFRPDRLFTGVWSLNMIAVTVGMTIILCQWRVALIVIGGKLRNIAFIAASLFLGELAFAIVATVKAFVLPNLIEFRKFAWTISAAYGLSVGSNAMLTSVLIFVLHRSRTGFQRTDSKIDTLIKYAVCTGLMTDLFGVLALVFALVQPSNLIYTGIDLVTSKLYVNSVLAALNFRDSVAPRKPTSGRTEGDRLSAYPRSIRQQVSDTEAWSHDLQYLSTASSGSMHVFDIKAVRNVESDGAVPIEPSDLPKDMV
ncbi:hypothetical protein ONZ51_g5956 [Trametes cubensis]|uniref:DUF6534 domain-containing protein n=1 Tax=Trametes cubensis TaxID=1111947 RepID=A0AAD7TT97_9APHY|nr:hypothetical protein ONZ51_g5956 [Trametes cubensis]